MRRGWACLVIGAIVLLGCDSADEPAARVVDATPPSTTMTPRSMTSSSTTGPPSTTTTEPPEVDVDGGDPFSALVEELPIEVAIFQTADGVIVARAGATTTVTIPVEEWAWSDGDHVYESIGWPDAISRAYDLEGSLVCEAEGRVLYVIERQDGGHVMAVEPVVEWTDQVVDSPQPVPLDAVDCQTGERQPIEPLSFINTEIGGGFIERIDGREFRGEYDAEGNADIVNEQGISVNGEDYAGYHAFAADGSLVVYGDMGLGAGPHLSTTIRMRDTTNGDLLWSAELPRPFASLQVIEAGVLAALVSVDAMQTGDFSMTDAVILLDRDTGSVVSTVLLPVRLVFAGP